MGQTTLTNKSNIEAKPFLKWVGGKRQLLKEIDSFLPTEVKKGKISKYFEPFLGGGAVFFYLNNKYEIKKAYLSDINRELILTYKVIQKDPDKLIYELSELSSKFLPKTQDERKEFYLSIRSKFNDDLSSFNFKEYSTSHIERASYIIFMNKTGYNGMFRLNKKGEFNVPCGRYKNPLICDKENIFTVSKALKNVNLSAENYSYCEELVDENSLIYLDPPYRPLSETSYFNSYTGDKFTEDDQLILADFYKRITDKGAKALLSNSDPKNVDINDNFFDDLFPKPRFTIERVKAIRAVNSKGDKRGKINEILVRNYEL